MVPEMTEGRRNDRVLTYLRSYIDQPGRYKDVDGRWWYRTPLEVVRKQISMPQVDFQAALDQLQAWDMYRPIEGDSKYGWVYYS